jgi:adenine-specific DNA glycosylase
VSGKPTYSTDFEPDEAKKRGGREALISWYDENARDLPWRRTRDPWRVLVSEVVLQQIQVKRAIPFYESFLSRFPTPRVLAYAPRAEAIRTWGALGRYRRVVNLHRTARILVEEFGGEVPSDPKVLVKLPGVGRYTAGAVACFAFEKDTALEVSKERLPRMGRVKVILAVLVHPFLSRYLGARVAGRTRSDLAPHAQGSLTHVAPS